MGSTWSGPVAYLQKQGCPMIGMPASLEMRWRFCVKFLWVDKSRKRILIKIQSGISKTKFYSWTFPLQLPPPPHVFLEEFMHTAECFSMYKHKYIHVYLHYFPLTFCSMFLLWTGSQGLLSRNWQSSCLIFNFYSTLIFFHIFLYIIWNMLHNFNFWLFQMFSCMHIHAMEK